MYMAPVAAGAALAYAVGSMGLATLLPLAKLVVTYYAALAVFVLLVLAADCPDCAHSAAAFRCGRGRAGCDRLCDDDVRGCTAAGDGAHGRVRRAALDRLFCHSYRLQLQYDGLERLSLDGGDLCGAGGGIHLTVGEQIVMLATLMLTSKGVAGRAARGAGHPAWEWRLRSIFPRRQS